MIWLFGETSDFSKTILKELKDKADPIKVFGRKNISYDKPPYKLDFNSTNKIIINIKLDANPKNEFLQFLYKMFISDLLEQCDNITSS